MSDRDQLGLVQALSDERIANEGLYTHQRNSENTFTEVLCTLIGLGAISDENLDWAIRLVRDADERIAEMRGVKA